MKARTARRTYQMLGNESLWATALGIDALLAREHIGYCIVGGVAVSLHGYRRNTVDLDLLVRREDAPRVFSLLEAEGYEWIEADKEFRSPAGVTVHFVFGGEAEGKGQEATFPSPHEPGRLTRIEGLPVLDLPQLIESKLACGQGDMRRTHRDFADVVELIAVHRLDKSFAGLLHKSVRKAFRQLVVRAGRVE